MNFTAVFLLVTLIIASASVGFWLGRQSMPKQRRRYGRRLPSSRTSIYGAVAAVPAARAPVARVDHTARLRRDIDSHMQDVRALRLARENAEPWRAPAVDRVAPNPQAVFFADTTIESYSPPQTPSNVLLAV